MQNQIKLELEDVTIGGLRKILKEKDLNPVGDKETLIFRLRK